MAFSYLETALEVARTAVVNKYGFPTIVRLGKGEEVKQLTDSTLCEGVMDHYCIKEILVIILFKESDS